MNYINDKLDAEDKSSMAPNLHSFEHETEAVSSPKLSEPLALWYLESMNICKYLQTNFSSSSILSIFLTNANFSVLNALIRFWLSSGLPMAK